MIHGKTEINTVNFNKNRNIANTETETHKNLNKNSNFHSLDRRIHRTHIQNRDIFRLISSKETWKQLIQRNKETWELRS